MLTLSDISESGGLSRWSCDKGREGPDEASSLAMKGPTQMTCDLVKESEPRPHRSQLFACPTEI